MKQLMEAFKSARKIELLIIAATVCVLLILTMGSGSEQGGAVSEEEERMQRILSRIEGAGNVSVMIAFGEDGAQQGVVVAATGADDVQVILRLQQAVHTLTGLELDRIEVVKSKR